MQAGRHRALSDLTMHSFTAWMVEQAAVYAPYREMRHLMLAPALDGVFRMPAANLPNAGLYATFPVLTTHPVAPWRRPVRQSQVRFKPPSDNRISPVR